ncbi:cysteine desulfurase family protein [Pedobacter jeongneungensis]|uniref:cysteine desulfurase family protein n=1 Tax=Pedobacter jeongneungensis TaxID=947309 RepID=UPI0004687CF2|nr:cysteine desulfurase family protein [Pedobacter jeongneungensis]
MEKITYLDNAATTALDTRVLDAMLPYLGEQYGNPSSSYAFGRLSRAAIELARKTVATHLGVKATNIYFTSGGTESNNTAISCAINDLGCSHVITSAIEHHSVLHTVQHHCASSAVSCSYVRLDKYGQVDLLDLEQQLTSKSANGIKCLVSLMHANNEIGAILDIGRVGELCRNHSAIFHSDCVQTIGHYAINLAEVGVHFASASGHKFHGPKGTGILYVSNDTSLTPYIHGGGQERKKRAGTENVHGIIGFSEALNIAMQQLVEDQEKIVGLNQKMQRGLLSISSEITFNSFTDCLYTVLSVNFPQGSDTDLLLSSFDRNGICASGGSACSSGDDGGSHVIAALGNNIPGATIRFSFSRMTSECDIDYAISRIAVELGKIENKVAH